MPSKAMVVAETLSKDSVIAESDTDVVSDALAPVCSVRLVVAESLTKSVPLNFA